MRRPPEGDHPDDAADRAYTEALVVIGDNQDELSAECRWALKTLRQRAGILMAMDAKPGATLETGPPKVLFQFQTRLQ